MPNLRRPAGSLKNKTLPYKPVNVASAVSFRPWTDTRRHELLFLTVSWTLFDSSLEIDDLSGQTAQSAQWKLEFDMARRAGIHAEQLFTAIQKFDSKIAVVGLGYVGLPLALTAGESGYSVLGFDINEDRVRQVNAGATVISHIPGSRFDSLIAKQRFEATSKFGRLSEADIIIICVPTPLSRYREPDLSFVLATTHAIAQSLKPGQLIILESTTYPGTTTEVLLPLLESRGLKSGIDFFLAFSPEREDPGNKEYGTSTIPKIVGGEGGDALSLATAFYRKIVSQVIPVSSTATAEAVKLTENIFRAVNIALVNELKLIYEAMGIDIWEVIEAAKTKPFGFMAFYPGPGLGGHCIPIDPFYLTWKAKEYNLSTKFVELAGEINTAMPAIIVDRLALAMDLRLRRGLNGSNILIVGVAYKKNIDDVRESPSLRLMELLEARGATTGFHDPHVPVIPNTREHTNLTARRSTDLTPDTLAKFDAVLIATDHDAVDYHLLVRDSKMVLDTRNACARKGVDMKKVVKA